MTTRRESIALLAGTTLGIAIDQLWRRNQSHTKAINFSNPNASLASLKILAVGSDARTHSHWQSRFGSVVTEILLGSGAITSRMLPFENGHSALPVGEGRILCISRDNDMSVILGQNENEFINVHAPEGYLYSGHGVLESSGATALLSIKKKVVATPDDLGMLQRIDLKSGSTLKLTSSGGIEPHEIGLLANGKIAVVSHYGSLRSKFKGSELYYDGAMACLVVLDTQDLRVIRTIRVPGHGALTHIDIAADGNVYAVPLQFAPMNEQGRSHLKSALNSNMFALASQDLAEQKIGCPSPIIRINPLSGQVDVFSQIVEFQRRAQSVAAHSKTGSVFVTYPNSGTLVRLSGKEGRLDKRSEFQLGLSNIRGVCDLPGTSFVAVSGHHQGIAIIDAHTLEVADRIETPLHLSFHLSVMTV